MPNPGDSETSGSYSEGNLINGYRSSSGLAAGGGPSRPLTKQDQLLDRIRRDSGSASSAYSFGSHSSDEKIHRPQDPSEKPLPEKPLPEMPSPEMLGAHTDGERATLQATLNAGIVAQRHPIRQRNALEGTPRQKAEGNAGANRPRTTAGMFAPGERPISSASIPGVDDQATLARLAAREEDKKDTTIRKEGSQQPGQRSEASPAASSNIPGVGRNPEGLTASELRAAAEQSKANLLRGGGQQGPGFIAAAPPRLEPPSKE